MRMAYLIVTPLIVLGCHGVIRDEAVYKTEVKFMEAASIQEAESITQLVKTHCKCENGSFVNKDCEKAAKRALVVQSRVPWHVSMMMYNARLSDDRPAVDPPSVPTVTSMCQ